MALVLWGAALPYLLALAAARRLSPSWGTAVSAATAFFGAVDVAVRMQAFFFPSERSGGAMGLWLPLSAVVAIPALAVLLHTAVGVFARGAAADHARRGDAPASR